MRLGRVGIIAVVGFAIGVLWPHVFGVRLVPSVPSEKGNTPELSGAPVATGTSGASARVEVDLPAAAPAAPAPAREPFLVSPGEVTSCRDEAGKKLERCDSVDFDGIARGRIATLAVCDVAQRAQGVLSVGFDLDFAADRVAGLLKGKSTSLSEEQTEALFSCLRQNLGEVSLAGIRHRHPRYAVFYRVEFTAGKSDKEAPGELHDVTPASGTATVAWDVALVRSAPARDAEVVARILQGTRVAVSARRGDWYRVKYDARRDKGGEGWIFRTAIGL